MAHIVGQIEFDCDIEALSEEIEKAGYVKVVRCKDCKRFRGDGLACQWGRFAYDDDYCRHGERKKTDEQTD